MGGLFSDESGCPETYDGMSLVGVTLQTVAEAEKSVVHKMLAEWYVIPTHKKLIFISVT